MVARQTDAIIQELVKNLGLEIQSKSRTRGNFGNQGEDGGPAKETQNE